MTANHSPALTDRYVAAAIAHVPAAQRDELAREIRGLVADTIESIEGRAAGAGAPLDAVAAERAALTELGDPAALAARYAGRIQYLIGPAFYPAWKRILWLTLPFSFIAGGVTIAAHMIGGDATVGEGIFAGISTGFQAFIQILFWFTLVFAIIERAVGADHAVPALEQTVGEFIAATDAVGRQFTGEAPANRAWTVDDLVTPEDLGRISLADTVATVAVNVGVAFALAWLARAFSIAVEDAGQFTLFSPEVMDLWVPWFVGVLLVEAVFTILVYRRGRYTMGYAIGNALLGAAFAIPAIYLLANDLLVNPELVAAIETATGTEWVRWSLVITGTVIVAIFLYDAWDGFRKARRADVALRQLGRAA